MSSMNLAEIANTQTSEIAVGFDTSNGFETLQRIANVFANSDITPKAFKGNHANCIIGVEMAMRMQASPLMVLQNLYIVHGSPSWSSQFLIATFNQCGKFSALRYEFVGDRDTDSWGCRAWAVEKSTGEKLVGTLVTLGMAKKEGWYSKSGSKWQSIPELMLQYRASAWFIRAYAPEIAMGLPTHEEAQDVYEMAQDDKGVFVSSNEMIEQETNINAEPTQQEDAAPKEEKKSSPKKPQVKLVNCPIEQADISASNCETCEEKTSCPNYQ